MILKILTLAIFCLAVVSASPTHHKGTSHYQTNPSLQAGTSFQANYAQQGKANSNYQDDLARLQKRLQDLQMKVGDISKEFVQIVKDSFALGIDLKLSALKGIISTLELGISSIANMGIFKNVAGSFTKMLEFPPHNSGSGLLGTGLNIPGMNLNGNTGLNSKGHGSASFPGAEIGGMLGLNFGFLGKKNQNAPGPNNGGHQGPLQNFGIGLPGNSNSNPVIPNLQPTIPNIIHPTHPGNQRQNSGSPQAPPNGALPNQKDEYPELPPYSSSTQDSANTGSEVAQGPQGGPQPPIDFGLNIPNLQDQNGPVDTNYPPYPALTSSEPTALVQGELDGLKEGMLNFDNPGGSVTDAAGLIKDGINALNKFPTSDNLHNLASDATQTIQGGIDTLGEKLPNSDASIGLNMEGLVPDVSSTQYQPAENSSPLNPSDPAVTSQTGNIAQGGVPTEPPSGPAPSQGKVNPFNKLTNALGKLF